MSPMEASTRWDGGIVIRWWNCHQLIRGIPLQEPLSWEVCVCVRFVCWEEVVKSDVLGRKYQVEMRAKGAELRVTPISQEIIVVEFLLNKEGC